jgi:hypothetical protein
VHIIAFICVSLYDSVSFSDYLISNGRVMGECYEELDNKWEEAVVTSGTIPVFTRKN